ncbi:FtsB family cell division protein [Lacticaseibacillus saniviri]|nr:septum formation initiator family protein [Lacticaseibacillus saniviri]MCG4281097.1 septum formation initiator family protein [Lacticaseibacillus saniviri]
MQKKGHSKASVKQIHRRRRMVLLGLMLVTLVLGGINVLKTQHTLGETNDALQTAQVTLKQTKAKRSVLQVQVDQLKNDDYLEKLVRQKYFVAKPGEVLFNIPDTANQISKN